MAFTSGVSYLPFANPPRFEAWTSTDLGFTLVPLVDDRTGKPAAFATKKEAQAALRVVLKAGAQKRIAA